MPIKSTSKSQSTSKTDNNCSIVDHSSNNSSSSNSDGNFKKNIILPGVNQRGYSIRGHRKACNIIRWRNDYQLFTGSDDGTLAFWDIRKLGNSMKQSIVDNSNNNSGGALIHRFQRYKDEGWIKNIEFYKNTNNIITCHKNPYTEDGSVILWNINDLSEKESCISIKSNFLRCKLTRYDDCYNKQKLIACGKQSLLLFDNLNLKYHKNDISINDDNSNNNNHHHNNNNSHNDFKWRSLTYDKLKDIEVKSQNKTIDLRQERIAAFGKTFKINDDTDNDRKEKEEKEMNLNDDDRYHEYEYGIGLPIECLFKENRLEIIELNKGYRTSLQMSPNNKYLIARGGHYDNSTIDRYQQKTTTMLVDLTRDICNSYSEKHNYNNNINFRNDNCNFWSNVANVRKNLKKRNCGRYNKTNKNKKNNNSNNNKFTNSGMVGIGYNDFGESCLFRHGEKVFPKKMNIDTYLKVVGKMNCNLTHFCRVIRSDMGMQLFDIFRLTHGSSDDFLFDALEDEDEVREAMENFANLGEAIRQSLQQRFVHDQNSIASTAMMNQDNIASNNDNNNNNNNNGIINNDMSEAEREFLREDVDSTDSAGSAESANSANSANSAHDQDDSEDDHDDGYDGDDGDDIDGFENDYDNESKDYFDNGTHGHFESIEDLNYEHWMIESICSFNDRCLWNLSDSSAGQGIIKEPSFDTTSTIIASPYHNGLRLLSVKNGKEIIDCVHGNEKMLNTHSNHVYTAQFSHSLPYLATGSEDGTVCIYYPR